MLIARRFCIPHSLFLIIDEKLNSDPEPSKPSEIKHITCNFSTCCALSLFSSLIGQADGVAGLIRLLSISDPQGEDVISLSHHVLAGLKYCLLILQPLGLGSFCIGLTVEHNFTSFLCLCVFNWCDDTQFFWNQQET